MGRELVRQKEKKNSTERERTIGLHLHPLKS